MLQRQEELQKEINLKSEYIHFFKQYVNEDWDRDNPFINIIETEQDIFFSRGKSGLVYPLNLKISELQLKEIEINKLKNVFKEDFDFIFNLALGNYLMKIAWLKSYERNKTVEEFYNIVFKPY